MTQSITCTPDFKISFKPTIYQEVAAYKTVNFLSTLLTFILLVGKTN